MFSCPLLKYVGNEQHGSYIYTMDCLFQLILFVLLDNMIQMGSRLERWWQSCKNNMDRAKRRNSKIMFAALTK